MTGRTFSASGTGKYRYGFNGKERDDEINVDGGSYDFGARIYDGRLGRWLSVDKLFFNEPGWSPYLFADCSPIFMIDKDGNSGVPHLPGTIIIATIQVQSYTSLGEPVIHPSSIGTYNNMITKLSRLNEKYYVRVHSTGTQTVPTLPSKDNPQMNILAGTVINHSQSIADKISEDVRKAGGYIDARGDIGGSTAVNLPNTPDLAKVELRSLKLDRLEQKLYEPTQGFMNSKFRNRWLGTHAVGRWEHRIQKRINREIKRIAKRAEKIVAE